MSINQFPPASVIKSIQRGVISLASGVNSGTATVSAVTTGKSDLRYLGISTVIDGSTVVSTFIRLTLTNSTTVTATKTTGAGPAGDVSWELTEYN